MSTMLHAAAAPAPAQAQASAQDAAAIETVVRSVGSLADCHDFDALAELYADEVRLDYTSLAGGEPEVVSGTEIMNRWAGVLPGFDRTHHALSDVKVTTEGDRARATATVVADHWLGAMHWRVRGNYAYELARSGSDWRITAHRFTVTGEDGSRVIFAPAAEAAKRRPAAWTVRQQARKVVLDFLTGLEEKDMARVNGVWADDAVQDMPYAPKGFPRRVVGREALVRQYAAWPQNSGKARFTDGIVFYPTRDPSIVVTEYHGVSEIVPTKRTYDQRYIGVFHVEDGKIALFREYFDPNVFSHAFGLGEGGDFYRGN